MSDWLDGSKTGDYAFTNRDGIPLYRGRTCNLYGSEDDAKKAACNTLRLGVTAYIWRTVDGLFDWSAIPDPRTPELANAEMVFQFRTSRRGQGKASR